jgi:hypothetical protein
MMGYVVFGGLQFGVNLWNNQPMERAIPKALLMTFVFGVLMHLACKYGFIKKKRN